jgi:hypothetical protein
MNASPWNLASSGGRRGRHRPGRVARHRVHAPAVLPRPEVHDVVRPPLEALGEATVGVLVALAVLEQRRLAPDVHAGRRVRRADGPINLTQVHVLERPPDGRLGGLSALLGRVRFLLAAADHYQGGEGEKRDESADRAVQARHETSIG